VRHPTPKSRTSTRPPRIRVPNNERALFTVDGQKFIGVLKRVSLTGGSAILAKGPIAQGTLGEMGLNTVFGKVKAQVQFLQSGADGMPLAQAFRFVDMNHISRARFTAAVEQMQRAGFSDVKADSKPLQLAFQTLAKLRDSIRYLAVAMTSGRRVGTKS
jgi:hypothetical protein